MNNYDYKNELNHYQEEIRSKIIDLQKRLNEIDKDLVDLSVYIQSGIFYNCIDKLENKE